MTKRTKRQQRIQQQASAASSDRETDSAAKSVDDTIVQRNEKSPSYGCKNYLPNKPVSEDHASVARHIHDMKLEYSKKKRDGKKIIDLMERTFHHRRVLIVDTTPSVSSLRDQFPCLFDEYQVVRQNRTNWFLYPYKKRFLIV